MKVKGNFVAVKQLTIPEVKQEKVRGLDMGVKFTRNLIASEILIDSDEFTAGTTVWFKADNAKVPQNQMVYDVEINGKLIKFVLFPKDYVVLVENGK